MDAEYKDMNESAPIPSLTLEPELENTPKLVVAEETKLQLRRRNGRSDSGGEPENCYLPDSQGSGSVITPWWQGKPWH